MRFSCLIKNKYFKLKSTKSNKLTKSEIRQICFLKNMQWKFGMKSQLKWFKYNIKKYDIHNLLYIRSKLAGYTLLRKRNYKIHDLSKKISYLYFDTLVVDKKYRGRKLSKLLMNFNNRIIKKSGFSSFLVCSDEFVNFYKNNNWKKLNRKLFNIVDHPFSSNGMIFNKKIPKRKISYYFNE